MTARIGSQVSSDLQLQDLCQHLPIQTKWGRERFISGLSECSTKPSQIRQKQLPLLIFAKHSAIRTRVQESLRGVEPHIEKIDECFQAYDARIQEWITQILWKRDSMGAFLNTSPLVLNTAITWKTLVLPGFAIFMPLLLMVLPFFVQRLENPALGVPEYLEHFKEVLLRQITVPTFLQPRSETDRVGFFLRSLFIGLTLVMCVSSLWNQITQSLHLRSIWFDLEARGLSIQTLRSAVASIVKDLKDLPLEEQRGLHGLFEKAEKALDTTKYLVNLDNVATFGKIWNNPDDLAELKDCIGFIDVYVSISSLRNICYPSIGEWNLVNAYHPALDTCVANSLSRQHTILTGPNRGGKSTFCRTIGLAVILAQSWGFAYAEKMRFQPFHSIYTVLEPCGKLGVLSTFEAEIEFAKQVLSTEERPMFVMMDEIFHSTNALDGVAASRVFLQKLYSLSGVQSIISTHYTQLATEFAKKVQPLQLVTEDKENGDLKYTYKVAPGVSNKSSVMEILRERGLA
jgi:hypothetical protein